MYFYTYINKQTAKNMSDPAFISELYHLSTKVTKKQSTIHDILKFT